MRLPKDKSVIVERQNKIVYDCGDTVVKVFNGTKPAADIMNEALNLARAEQAGINVPELVEVSKAGVNWAIATKKVDRPTMRELMLASPDKVDELLDTFVQLELDVHTHSNPLLNRQKDKLARMINSTGDAITDAQRYELLQTLDGMPNHTKICHGDFVPSNVIAADGGEPAVILDWAHATQGNGGADCAISYLHFILGGERDFAEKYLDRYCELQGCSKTYVQSWLPIVAAAELARGRVNEMDFLLSWVNVVDWV